MALPKDFAEALDTHLELAGKLLDQASILKQKVDSVEYDRAVAELTNKVIRLKT